MLAAQPPSPQLFVRAAGLPRKDPSMSIDRLRASATSSSTVLRAAARLALCASALAPLGCSDEPDADIALRMSSSGRVTALCGHPAPLPYGYVGTSPAGPCEGVCSSTGAGGGCQDPADGASRLDVYGCAGKTSTNGYSCDGDHNGGVLLATFNNGSWHSVAEFADALDYCTYQLDILRPGGSDPIGLRDFLVWERDDCSPDVDPCVCTGGVDHLGNSVTGSCGEQVCGADFQYYTCEQSGWVAQGGVCPGDPPCECPEGWDYLGNPVTGTCGQQVCGADFQFYTCEQSVWVSQGVPCPDEPPPCYCPDGWDHLGNPVTGDFCGEKICGADYQHYTCEESGWVAQNDVCPGECDCTDGVDHLGNPISTTICGEQVCGADHQYYSCETSGWVAQGGTCGGGGDGDLIFDTPAELEDALADGVDIRGATINFVFKLHVDMKDFRDVHFAAGVDGGWFFGTDLRGATFSGQVEHAPFLYADLAGADFSGATLSKCDFAFTFNADAASWPAPGQISNTVYTGAGSRSAPMLPHAPLNQLTGAPTLEDLLGDGTVTDGMLGSSWRSYLYDALQTCAPGTDKYFHLKSRIFDAVDGRYSSKTYVSPPGGPTLDYLYDLDYELDGTPDLRGYIDRALADLVASDETAHFDDPFIGRVSWSSEPYFLDNFADGYLDPEDWYAALATYPVQWNTPTASRNAAEVAVHPKTILAVTAALSGTALTEWTQVSQDRLVSPEDLAGLSQRATIVAALHDVYRDRPQGEPLGCLP